MQHGKNRDGVMPGYYNIQEKEHVIIPEWGWGNTVSGKDSWGGNTELYDDVELGIV